MVESRQLRVALSNDNNAPQARSVQYEAVNIKGDKMQKLNMGYYDWSNKVLFDIAEKIAEGDGSPDFSSMISYLAEASSLLAHAIHELSEEHYVAKTEQQYEK